MMLGHTANAIAKKSSKFEDSDSRMSRPSAVSELPQRPAQRPKSSSLEASGGTPRRALGVRGAAPRSPLHEKKPAGAGAGAGAGPRVAELEGKLETAHGQLMGMREQLAAADKARKEARAALADAKKRLAAKKKDDGGKEPAAAAAEAAADVAESDLNSPVTDALKAVVRSESETSNNVVADDDDGKKGGAEVESLRAKLMARDMEVYELRAKLMVIDTEVDDMRGKVMAKSTELDELRETLMSRNELVDKLTANLMVKDAEIAALEADSAELTKMAEEAGEAASAAAARARETEHALRESAAREARLAERLRASEHAREALEAEAQRSRVQSEQWRKAAEEAAAVLGSSGDAETATDKRRHMSASASAGDSGCTAANNGEEGRRKAGGAVRALTDLWKKKAHK